LIAGAPRQSDDVVLGMRDNVRMGDEGVRAASTDEPVRVFMSYRRADDRHFIGRLHDRLCDAFGDEMVFRDIDSIPAGTNFRQVILRTLNEVDAVVAVIGPNWARSDSDHPAGTDFVFLELAEALKQGKPVVPVLVEDTLVPSSAELPQDLRALVDINAISVRGDPAFRHDSAHLVEAIGAVVAENRARLARERHEADERARRTAAERSERERVAQQLRAEERAARARLAELEDAAARRQIEQERARLDAIEEQLRQAESVKETTSVGAPEASETMPVEPAAAALVEPPRVVAPGETPAAQSTASPSAAPTASASTAATEGPWKEILIIAALVFGVVGLSVNRGVDSPFNELSSTTPVDVSIWILTLAIGVPLLMGRHPVEQRFVLAGVALSSFFFEFLQASAVVHYEIDGFNEGTWFLLKVLQTLCLAGAYIVVRRRSAELPLSASRRLRIPLIVIAIGCATSLLIATNGEWNHALELVENGYVPGRTPLGVWLLVLALGPIVVIIALAARGSYASQIALATIATLGTVTYFGQATFVDNTWGFDGSYWTSTALAHLLLAAAAWFAVVARARSTTPSP
jgi:hypothetical protein